MSLGFWKGKRVFLTGHTGFKGGWASLWLQALGAKLTGYSLPPTGDNIFEAADVANGMTSLTGDIRDLPKLKESMKSANADIVIHMAAQPLVRLSYKDPVETHSTNVMGTVNLLEAVRYCENVKAVVVVTSDKCYKNKEWVWGYRENEPMGGHDPYSSSKGCTELVASSYRSSFFNAENGVSVATARAGNVIGGGDWSEDRLVPDIIKAFENRKLAAIRNPNAIRPWQYVLEPLRGYLMLAEKLYLEGSSYAEGWNFGPVDTDVKSVGWIADRLSNLWGADASWNSVTSPKDPHEASFLKLDCSKANSKLGWKPLTDLSFALSSTVEWHRAYKDAADMKRKTLNQIQDYEKYYKVNNNVSNQ